MSVDFKLRITKFRLVLKIMKLLFFRVFTRKWFLPGVAEITVEELYEEFEAKKLPILLDLRTMKEFYGKLKEEKNNYGHIPGAYSTPYLDLAEKMKQFDSMKDKKFVTICPGGGMSLSAVDMLSKAGFTNVVSLKGGMELWKKSGYPTTTEDTTSFETINK